MSLLEMLLIAAGLAMDAFAVSLAAGAAGHAGSPRPVFRLSFHFGLFQFLMPVAGWYAGTRIVQHIAAVDHWIAFGLLAVVGGRMIRSGCSGDDTVRRADPSRGLTLVALSTATSIDALAVGLSLAMLRISIWYPSALIGVVTAGLSVGGVILGRRAGRRLGGRVEILGGVILLGIGLRILVTHLMAESG